MKEFIRTKSTVILLFIVVLGTFLRFFQLSQNPPSLTWDEAAWGYNAFSLLHTGGDEFGKPLPLSYLESFGDFKPTLYAYLSIVPVALFGLNEFSTRFVSAFFGACTVLITYFLAKRIFFSSENRGKYALLSAFFLAISPWHINLSRAAFEANLATFFIVSGVWLFLAGIQKRKWFLVFSAISFACSLYTFNTSRVVVPILVIVLVVIFSKKLYAQRSQAIIAAVVGVCVLLPLIPFLFSPQAQLRYKEVNIFSDAGPVNVANEHRSNNHNAWWSGILDNRRVFYAREYVKHYFDNLNPSFLFIKGDGNPKFSTQRVGEMYFFDAFFLVAGTLLLFRRREGYWYVLPLWFLLGIIPAATARETPHALRIETVLPVPQVLVAYGVVQVVGYVSKMSFLRRKYLRFGLIGGFSLLLFLNVASYLHDYYTHYPKAFSGEWQYGYKEAFSYTREIEDSFDKIFVTTDLGRPYAYYLFYTQLQPQDFQKKSLVRRDSFGFVAVDKVGKYHFQQNLPGEKDATTDRVLYINSPSKVPAGATIQKTFFLLNGEPSLVAYTLG